MCVLPAPAATGEAALPACCAAGGWGAMPQVTGRGCNLTTDMTNRSLTGRYLRDGKRESETEGGRSEFPWDCWVVVATQHDWFQITLINHIMLWWLLCAHCASVLCCYGYTWRNRSFSIICLLYLFILKKKTCCVTIEQLKNIGEEEK